MAQTDLNPWELAQDRLKNKLDEHSYKNWFAHTRFGSLEQGALVVLVPSQFFADWLKDHYLDTISECVREFVPTLEKVSFRPSTEMEQLSGRVEDEAQPPSYPAPLGKSRRQAKAVGSAFNPRYVFDRFVVGSGNRFANAAALAVAESPARAYNPLFLYGGTGLGKTHLMQAIGQDIQRHTPGANVVFTSSEVFTNQLIDSIAKKSTQRFRARYRKVDVLLIDDIQFIAGKEATQEEFFHTFNALFDLSKQIVISSDRQPKEIQGLEERLVSRFEWGLVTDIQPPDLETRIAILQHKAEEENFAVAPDILKYIGTYVTNNIRELEGALITVIAYSKLTKQAITQNMVEEVLHDLIGRDKIKRITVEAVQRAIGEYFDVRISDLRGRSRQRQISFPRQIAMYLCKTLIPNMSLTEIGEAFGGKDHTTVLYAVQKIEKEQVNNTVTRQSVSAVTKKINA
jgi:chromosomal replication initiator protein